MAADASALIPDPPRTGPDHHIDDVVERSADRQTLYPVGASETERLTRWLSADADAFVILDEMR